MRVKSGVAPQTVALWERDPRHPTGEIFIAGGGTADVHPTPMVQRCLKTGVLVAVDVPSASTNDEELPTTSDPPTNESSAEAPGADVEPIDDEGDPPAPTETISLTAVKGIGKVMAANLEAMGIHTLTDLIAADAATLDAALPTNTRAIVDWQIQAQELRDATP